MFTYEEQPNFPARYNIAPTQPIPIVHAVSDDGLIKRHFRLARWGFLPGFVKNPKEFPLVFNARSEGLDRKPSFSNALRRRRCLVPADAFYEWRRSGTGKTARSIPYLFRRSDGTTMALAGLWEIWLGPNGEEVDTACIVTTGANGVSAAIHPRLPVVIEPDAFAQWLDPDETTYDRATALLRPCGNEVLAFTRIGDAVNKVANDFPEIQTPVAEPTEHGPRQASLF
jgi:putative SOS response-associated peptidase YedK